MAVAGLVQLDKGALFVVGQDACDGIVSDGGGLECFEICSVSGSCQRPSGTGPSSVTACWNQPLMFINAIRLYQYHEGVPKVQILK